MKAVHFCIEELVSKEILDEIGEERAWRLIDPKIIYTLDHIRQRYGKKVTVNNWKWNSSPTAFKERCLRKPDTKTGSKWSDHKYGRAVDFDVEGMTAAEVRKDILANKDHEDFKYITILEDGVSWVHIGVANLANDADRIFVVYPDGK